VYIFVVPTSTSNLETNTPLGPSITGYRHGKTSTSHGSKPATTTTTSANSDQSSVRSPHPPLDADVDVDANADADAGRGWGRNSNKSLINRRLLLSALLLLRCFCSALALLSVCFCSARCWRAFCLRCVGVIRYDTVFPKRFSYYRSFAKSSCRERKSIYFC